MAKRTGKTLLAISLMVLPLILAVAYERSLAHDTPVISSIAIVPPIFHGLDTDSGMAIEVLQTLSEQLKAIPGLQVLSGSGIDLMKVGKDLGADAVVAVSMTVDSGIVQIEVKVIDARTGEVLWNAPYEGRDQYHQMIRAVGDTMRQNLHFK